VDDCLAQLEARKRLRAGGWPPVSAGCAPGDGYLVAARVSARPQVESLTRGPRCNPLSLLVAHLAQRLR
jgi:hypothetical protein